MPRKRKRGRSIGRNEEGFQLIELLVAVLVLSIFLGQVMQGLAQMHAQTTTPMNQTLALNMCQELFDAARNQSFDTLVAAADNNWHEVIVNRDSPGQVAGGQPAYLKTQLMLDLSSGSGASYSDQGMNALFRGTVEQRLELVSADQIRLTVRTTWPSETGGAGLRTSTMTTLIYRNGIINK